MESTATGYYPEFNIISGVINPLTHEQILEQVDVWVKKHSFGHFIVVANTHVLMESRVNPTLKQAIDQANLVIPDGMPLVLTGRLRGFPNTQRADGPTLLVKALADSSKNGWKHFFFGSTPGVLAGMQDKINKTCPGVQVAGMFSPPFHSLTEQEDEAIIQKINASEPDILWVGLGCPKQEIWMFEHCTKVNVPLMVGVGMAFDILAGNKPRAPRWMQVGGLEWLFRLLKEPKRLWKRYLKYNTQFLILVTIEQIGYWWGKIRQRNQ